MAVRRSETSKMTERPRIRKHDDRIR